jgi:hypothetical protein
MKYDSEVVVVNKASLNQKQIRKICTYKMKLKNISSEK